MKKAYYLYREDNGKSVRIEEGQDVTVGRAFDNTIVIEEVSISRHHASICWKKDAMYVTDMNSTNGTTVNGEKVSADYFYELNYADQVMIGNVAFRILDEEGVIARNFSGATKPPKTVIVHPDDGKKKDDASS